MFCAELYFQTSPNQKETPLDLLGLVISLSQWQWVGSYIPELPMIWESDLFRRTVCPKIGVFFAPNAVVHHHFPFWNSHRKRDFFKSHSWINAPWSVTSYAHSSEAPPKNKQQPEVSVQQSSGPDTVRHLSAFGMSGGCLARCIFF